MLLLASDKMVVRGSFHKTLYWNTYFRIHKIYKSRNLFVGSWLADWNNNETVPTSVILLSLGLLQGSTTRTFQLSLQFKQCFCSYQSSFLLFKHLHLIISFCFPKCTHTDITEVKNLHYFLHINTTGNGIHLSEIKMAMVDREYDLWLSRWI